MTVRISIHTPARGVTVVNSNLEMQVVFQSTLPQGEWRLPTYILDVLNEISIHTPARGVTDIPLIIIVGFNISIHTPARGVTLNDILIWSSVIISIHTPARGVTLCQPCIAEIRLTFQSTLPQGEWLFFTQIMDGGKKISIHTPARGVTTTRVRFTIIRKISIHTPARGVTPWRTGKSDKWTNFNPHSRKGSDFSVLSATK